MSRFLRVMLSLTWVAGFLILLRAAQAFELPATFASKTGAMYFFVLLVFAILTEMKPVPYTLGSADKDEVLTITIILLTLFAFGPTPAILVAAASVLVADLAANRMYYKTLFNVSMYVIATAAAGIVYHLAVGQISAYPILPVVLTQILTRFAAGATYYVVNLILLMTVLSQVQGLPFKQMIALGLRDSAIVNLALISIAVGMSLLWGLHPVAPIVLIPSVLMAKIGYQGYTRLRTEAESTLAVLADLLDLRDHYTGKHSLRVAEMSYGVARVLGLSEDQALAVKAIARVHDIGKVVVRDNVLLRAGPLSPEQEIAVRAHVEAGGHVLSHLSVYAPYLPILLQHHEHFDGHGYPVGLRGEKIEPGARILAVCDAYDTMTSDRPYQHRVPEYAAMADLFRHAGSQFDPKVVKAAETWLIQERKLRPDWRSILEDVPADDRTLAPSTSDRVMS